MKSFREFAKQYHVSLQYHKVLNQKLWVGERLDPQVRNKLLEIAKAWQTFARIPDSAVKDIVLTGGNANFNYTSNSDLDVHFVVDYSKITNDSDIVADYFMAKKSLWAATHKGISVRGYPVELYAENQNQKHHPGQGVYSLKNNTWIHKPAFENINFNKDGLLKQKVLFMMKEIDQVVRGKQNIETATALRDKIRMMRGAAIQNGGEFSFENLVFKELRNNGYLDKLSNYLKSNQEKQLSLK